MKKTDHLRHISLRDRVGVLLRALPTAVAVMDCHGVVRYGWNPAAESLFGRTASEAIGKVIPLLDGGCDVDFADLLRRAATGEAISGTELRYERRDGSSVYVSVSLAPAASIAGVGVGTRTGAHRDVRTIVGLFEDITQRKQAEDLLRPTVRNVSGACSKSVSGMASCWFWILGLCMRIGELPRCLAVSPRNWPGSWWRTCAILMTCGMSQPEWSDSRVAISITSTRRTATFTRTGPL